jgi:hypothetical protein
MIALWLLPNILVPAVVTIAGNGSTDDFFLLEDVALLMNT